MKVTVVTPSYNQAQFLPENLRTVSQQVGVDLEHIIVDPGSTDGSTEIARAASHARLLAEPDRGQSHGITKGYALATGDIVTWLNSDDMYPSPDTLAKVVRAFEANPSADVIYGGVNFVDERGEFLRRGFVNKDSQNLLASFHYQVGIVQPGVFMRKAVFDALGGPSESYNYCMDYEYWVRIANAGFKWVYLDDVLAHHRWWDGMKTSSGRGDSLIEHFKVCATYFGYIHHKWLDRYGEFVATKSDGVVNHAATVDAALKTACVRRTIRRFVTQDMLALMERSADPEIVATLAYVRQHVPDLQRIVFSDEELDGIVSENPDPQAHQRVAWRIFDTRSSDGRTFKTYKVPNNFSRHFDTTWYHDEIEQSRERLRRMSGRRKESCVIVANGPSLNKSNLDLLVNADVIISNFAVISKKLQATATYLTIVNDLVAKQGTVDFNRLDIPKLVPFWLGNSLTRGDNTVFLPATVEPVFCGDIDGTFSWRSTVSFLNMQLAFALGYENVVLIGFDHFYRQPTEVREGTAIVQQEEDENHFDPRYFQGKTWQAADTANMEKMYLVARDAYAAAGKRIVNATVGGHLEVFPRMGLEDALGLRKSAIAARARSLPAEVSSKGTEPVRLLVLDMTPIGSGSATGEIKATLFAGWPSDRLLQIARTGRTGLELVQGSPEGNYTSTLVGPEAAQRAVEDFRPEAILYRPVPDAKDLHDFAMATIRRLDLPLITWIMDDWPDRLIVDDPTQWGELGPDLKWLLETSRLRLSICDAMSKAYKKRYGHDFVAVANGVDPDDWPAPRMHSGKKLLLRYAGGLAANMTLASVLRVARAVERLGARGFDISFQINTQKWWLDRVQPAFAGLKHTLIESNARSPGAYRTWLSEADAVLIAYNFDSATRRYVRYSMANKMPECLASGASLLAVGPRGLATIDYLAGSEAAMVVDRDKDEAVEAALLDLLDHPEKRTTLAAAGHALALSKHNVREVRRELHALITKATGKSPDGERTFAVLDGVAANGRSHRSVPEGGDVLTRLALTDAYGMPPLMLHSCTNALLLDPAGSLKRLAEDRILSDAVDRALSALPDEHEVKGHYLRVHAFVREGQGSGRMP